MLVHIVFWRLLEEGANGRPKEENARELKRRLEALLGVIPGLLRCEVGIDVSRTDESADIALYSELASKEALDAYQIHPAHKEVGAFIKEIRAERRVVDYQRG